MNHLLRACLVLAMACAPTAVPAHTSFLLPNYFSLTEGKMITLEGGFAEKFFNSDVALTSQDFHLYHPDGRRDAFKKITSFDQITILESDIPESGTYLFTSGERLGRISTIAKVKGEWVSVNPDDPNAKVPADATETSKLQTATVTDVYVTKGAPSKAVLALPPQGRLAITPVTHPSAIFLDEGCELAVSYGGKPLTNFETTLYRQGGGYDEKSFAQINKTDANGHLKLKFSQPGVYLIMARHRGDAPPGAATPLRSYTTSLTFEVAR
jgi:uncharacterized GH25 family protein